MKVLCLMIACGLLGCPTLVRAQRAQGGDFVVRAQRTQGGNFGTSPDSQSPLTIAAAADLNFALSEIAKRFEQRTGEAVRLTFGSSGNLSMQIENGAPFDLFFSADMEYPRKLQSAGLAESGTFARYATGRLVLWLPAGSPLHPERDGIRVLLDPAVKRIAIANPQHAPYGRAAIEALRYFELYEKAAPKLVLGENVTQAVQFVESGNAQAGFIALALALAPTMKNKGRYWEVPIEAYGALAQGAVMVKSSRHKEAARRFLEFLKTPEATDILKHYGFAVPETAR